MPAAPEAAKVRVLAPVRVVELDKTILPAATFTVVAVPVTVFKLAAPVTVTAKD